MPRYDIPLSWPSEFYEYGPKPIDAHWTSYPNYAYAQFFRNNPRKQKARRNSTMVATTQTVPYVEVDIPSSSFPAKPVDWPVATNAGPFLPQMFPYGQGGRPVTYSLSNPLKEFQPRRYLLRVMKNGKMVGSLGAFQTLTEANYEWAIAEADYQESTPELQRLAEMVEIVVLDTKTGDLVDREKLLEGARKTEKQRFTALKNPKEYPFRFEPSESRVVGADFVLLIEPDKSFEIRKVRNLGSSWNSEYLPRSLSFKSPEQAFDAVIQLEQQEKEARESAFEGGFADRMGRISSGTANELARMRAEADLIFKALLIADRYIPSLDMLWPNPRRKAKRNYAGSGSQGGFSEVERAELPGWYFLSGRSWPAGDPRRGARDDMHALEVVKYMNRGFGNRRQYPSLIAALAERYPVGDRSNQAIWSFYDIKRSSIEAKAGTRMPSLRDLA